MTFLSFWAIIVLWLTRVFIIMFVRDLLYKDHYDGNWHQIENSTRKLGMNTPKGLLIRNYHGGDEGVASTITPPISNLRIVKDSSDEVTKWKIQRRPFLDRFINLISFEI